MAKNKTKEHFMAQPIEHFETAPLANIYKTKPVSNVPMPCELEVRNAKEWVDTNQK